MLSTKIEQQGGRRDPAGLKQIQLFFFTPHFFSVQLVAAAVYTVFVVGGGDCGGAPLSKIICLWFICAVSLNFLII